MVHSFEGERPDISRACFIAWNAEVSRPRYPSARALRSGTAPFFAATSPRSPSAREATSRTGPSSTSTPETPCVVGEYVTIGHGAVVHACEVGDRCLIGMGAVILNGAVIGEDSIVGASALVTQGKAFPPRSMILGSPAKVVRPLTDEEVARLAPSRRGLHRPRPPRRIGLPGDVRTPLKRASGALRYSSKEHAHETVRHQIGGAGSLPPRAYQTRPRADTSSGSSTATWTGTT